MYHKLFEMNLINDPLVKSEYSNSVNMNTQSMENMIDNEWVLPIPTLLTNIPNSEPQLSIHKTYNTYENENEKIDTKEFIRRVSPNQCTNPNTYSINCDTNTNPNQSSNNTMPLIPPLPKINMTDKNKSEILMEEAFEFMCQKQYSEAIIKYTNAIKLYSKNALYFLNRAVAYANLRNSVQVIHDWCVYYTNCF